jgi:lipopolysaccharide/colanic/teichoic acid biosynthesis glycosyltransferase
MSPRMRVDTPNSCIDVPTDHFLVWTDDGLSTSNNWRRPLHLGLKRFIDIAVSVLSLFFLSPLFVVLALLIKLTSPGPVIYRWRVVGRHGHPFIGYKFRSMVANADQLRSRLQSRNEMTGPVFKLTDDPRITPVGRWLRRFSLDELPQLWSVLKGDMSLVGPRPPLQEEYRLFTPKQKLKLSVKPGITCLWQVNGRNEITDFDEWIRLDLQYIEKWSLALDCKILLRTILAVVKGKGK